MKVRLSGSIPGFEHLRQLLIYGYGHFQRLLAFSIGDERASYKLVLKTDATADNLEFEAIATGKTYIKFLRDEFESYLLSILDLDEPREKRRIILPKHLEDFVPKHIHAWSESIVTAMLQEENKHYRVQSSLKRENVTIVAPVDFGNTGQIQEGVHWSNGLHQFIQIKHELPISSEGLVSVFMSYVGYVLKYANIYGLTATLGTTEHRELLKDVYGTDSVIIPSFIKNKLIVHPTILEDGFENWSQRIVTRAIEVAEKENRAVLIIMQTIKEQQLITEMLKERDYPREKLFEHIDATTQEEVEKMKHPGEIIIATNIGGRGTDIKLSKKVNRNGGLHTLITNFPVSSRVQYQAQRRSARKEESGSTQMILNIKTTYPACDGDLSCFNIARKTAEIEALKKMQVCHLPYMKLTDELFEKSVRLTRMAEAPTGHDLLFAHNKVPNELRDDTIYIYVKDRRNIHLVSVRQDRVFDLDITTSVRNLDEETYTKVITASKKDTHETFTFNRQNFELFHFIAAFNGHDLKQEAMARVIVDYEHFRSTLNEKDYLESKLNSKLSTQEEIIFAREQVLYKLWQKDLEIYNKQTEIRQMQERFAIWLKEQTDVFQSETRECEIYSEETTQNERNKFLEISTQTYKSFSEFESVITAELKNGTLMKNPAHLIHRAFTLKKISGSQRSHPHGVIQIYGDYPFLKDEPNFSNKGWWESVQEMGSYIVGQVSNLFSDGKIEATKVYVQNPMDKAIDDLQRAINADELYSWPAHNAMAYLRLDRDGKGIHHQRQTHDAHRVKQRFVDDASNARNKLAGFEIPRREQELAFLLINNMTKIDSHLALDYLWQIAVFNNILEQLEKNIKTTTASSGLQMIYVGHFIQLRELKNINITAEVEGKEFAAKLNISISGNTPWESNSTNKEPILPKKLDKDQMIQELLSSGVFLYSINVYDLERIKKKNSWFGSFFSGLLGISQVLAGLALIASGGTFAPIFGSSLLMQGIGDVITSLESVITGQPIDLDGYFKGKAIGLAISLITASVATIGGFSATSLSLNDAIKTTVMLRTFSKVLESVGNHLVRSNDGEIEANIKRAVEEFMREHEAELEAICATAAYNAGMNECDANTYNEIIAKTYELLRKHQKKFHGIAPTAIKGVISGVLGTVFGGKPFSTAGFGTAVGLDAGLGLVEAMTLTSDILDGLDGTVASMHDTSLNPKQMMRHSIKNKYPSNTKIIIDMLEAGNVFSTLQHPASAHLCCKCIDKTDLETFESNRDIITSLCNEIASLFAPNANSAAKNALVHSLNEALLKRMHGVIHQGFTVPVTNWASSGITNKINEHLSEKAKMDVKKQRAAEREARRREIAEKGFKGHLQDLEEAIQQRETCEWQNPDEIGIDVELVTQKKSQKELNKQQKKSLNAYKDLQKFTQKEAKEELRKVDQEERSGKLTKEHARAERETIRDQYQYILDGNRQKLEHHHPELSDLAQITQLTALQSIYGSTSPKIAGMITNLEHIQERSRQDGVQDIQPKDGKYKLHIYLDNHESLTGHSYVGLEDSNGNEKLFGQNPKHENWPVDKGFIKDEESRKNLAMKNEKATVIKKTITLSKEDYEAALNHAKFIQSNPKSYAGHVGYDCIEFVQDIYVASKQKGDFVDLYTVKELKKMGLAGFSARNRYGAGNEYFTVYSTNKEAVANKYNVPVDSLKTETFEAWGVYGHQSVLVIEPKIKDQSVE